MRCRWMILAGAGVVGGVVGYRATNALSDQRQWAQLSVECCSDQLPQLALAMRTAAAENGGVLPEWSAVEGRLAPKHREWVLTCRGSGRAFVRGTLPRRLDAAGPVPVAWCPEGSHGRYAGVLVVRDGRVECERMTEEELGRLRGEAGE